MEHKVFADNYDPKKCEAQDAIKLFEGVYLCVEHLKC